MTSATCRCPRTSSARTRRPIAIAIRRSMRAARVRRGSDRGTCLFHACDSRQSREARCGAAAITLHVGYGTFQPVRVDQVEAHTIDAGGSRSAKLRLTRSTARNATSARVLAVGTTPRARWNPRDAPAAASSAAIGVERPVHLSGLQVRDRRRLMTNFHLRVVALLMLTCALAGAKRCWRPTRSGGAALSFL